MFAPAVMEALTPSLASSTYENGAWTSRQSHWWTGLEHTLHKNFLMIGQPVVERLFASRLDKTQTLFDTRCVSIEEGPSSVTLTTDNRDHPVIRSRYVVGADGARSTVRHLMGISFTGTKPEMVWTVLDTFIDTDFPRADEIVTFQCNGQSRVSWIPRERGMARFYSLLDPDVDKTQANSEAFIREHMSPHRIDFVKTEWFSTFESKQARIASIAWHDSPGSLARAHTNPPPSYPPPIQLQMHKDPSIRY